ncbi:hypothetical protein BY996DRAFT_2821420 [Phakopsora pachyrhizi]|nr:hypothetical protein BY996DRAFT_2821420 [Phakopsora pachyrhizi]
MAEIPNRLKSLYDMIDGNLWIENDAFNINFSHKNLNFANTENLKKLKSPFVSLKELFFEIKTKDLLINSAMVSKKEKEGVLEISKIITEQIINTLIALRFSMYNFEDTLKVNDNFVVTESQLDLVQKDIKKIYHCWLGLVECIERFLMALETCDDRIDAGQTVLSLEISWRFDLCLGFVDEANLHLNLYKHSNFIEDLYSLDEKFATKMDWIDYFFKKTLNNRALNLIRDLDLNQIPNDLRIDYNSVFLKTWKRLMTLFLLFIKKASRKNRSLMKIYLILDKDKLILLLQEIHKWSQNYCVDLQHGWIVSKDKEIGETVESMIDSIKNFQTVFFKLRPAKQNTKCKKPNCYIDKVFGHIENIENYLFDIDRVDENEEEKELRTWLEHWLDQVILILKSCFRIHFQSFQSH